jgi:hypothetical protein
MATIDQRVLDRYLKSSSTKDKIPGGLSDKADPKDFDAKQLTKGTKVEMEHTDDPAIAKEIAMDHLSEDKDYYKKLEKMEKSASNKVVERYQKTVATF